MWIEPVRDWNMQVGLILILRIQVWIEPVRDWNFILQRHPKHRAKCELNLWGIETFNCHSKIFKPYFVWIEPVRDWNWASELSDKASDKMWIEPVRDWNLFLPCLNNLNNLVWIEPVRDWNTLNQRKVKRARDSVNWTCEGLKQNFYFAGNPLYPVWIEPVRDWNLSSNPMVVQ